MEKLKILKGIQDPERKPSKKGTGFISIEKQTITSLVHMVFRNYLGANLFSGVINSKSSQIKALSSKPGRLEVKVSVMCKDALTKEFGLEHCVIRFGKEAEREQFMKVFSECLKKKDAE